MDKHYVFKTEGVCAKEISFDIIDEMIRNVEFTGGCPGNSKGVALLAEGMRAEDVVKRLRGIGCHGGTSCPDQLAHAIENCLAENEA